MSVLEEKKALRAIYKAKRKAISAAEKERFDRKIESALCSMEPYKTAETIFAYASAFGEVDTMHFIQHALADGKTVALPRCVSGTHQMEFYSISSLCELEKGAYGILEPKQNPKNKLENFKKGLCVVPALCYDKKGYRLGYGGGYYDRFLQGFAGFTLGLTYESCFCEALPTDEFDCKVQAVLTPERTIIL